MLDGAFDHEVARSLAAKGGLGIAEQLVGEIEREQATRASAANAAPAQIASASTATPTSTHALAAVAVDGTVLPVVGEISSPFGLRADPFTGAPRFHAGVDVAAPRGTAIHAVADGEVVFSGWRRGGGGRVVEVRHADGLVTSYAHADRTLVRAGQHVVAGEVVATVGSSGRASGPHLHFAASRDGQPIDPSEILEPRHVLAALPDAI
jgi:murein DD-endopeptidase MepM/ murein hydrolase activator NlpD